jgi:hypothetical protein
MNRTSKKKDDVVEMTLGEFRAILLKSTQKLRNKETSKKGFEEMQALIDQMRGGDGSLGVFVVLFFQHFFYSRLMISSQRVA